MPEQHDCQPHGPGMGMLVAGCVLALAMLTWLFTGLESRRYNPNQNPESFVRQTAGSEYLEVALQRNPWNQYLASGYINQVKVDFLIDTGANVTSIPASLEQRLGLERGRMGYAKTANGTARVYDTTLQQIELSGIKRENIRASIIETMDGEYVLLGMNFLSTLQMLQTDNTLVLRERI